ncbi:MAG: APC family permease, partial [Cruoricaptor ignavus]|nr:APC family permease [Cruoricaptor ignavus]
MKDQQKLIAKYGLFTAISMVIGQVIGSGIFFKVDDVLVATNGNIYAGLLGFIIVGISVIFAATSMANYAELLPKDGGILNYVSFRFGKKAATLVGWMYFSLFFPILTAVVFTVSGIYISHFIKEFIPFEPTFLHYSLIGFFNSIIFLIINIYKPKTSGILQQITTVLKLIPLILISAIGIVLMLNSENSDTQTFSQHAQITSSNSQLWLLVAASFIPIAFAFDGWYVATQISGEIKNSKKNLPLAMVLGTFIIM